MMEDTGPPETISKEKMTRLLAETTDSDPEELADASEDFEVDPPWEADIEKVE